MNNVIYCDIELGRLIHPIFLFPGRGSVGIGPTLVGQAPAAILEETLIQKSKEYNSHKIYLKGLQDYNTKIKNNINEILKNRYSDYSITVELI